MFCVAVYMSRQRHLWDKDKVFTSSLILMSDTKSSDDGSSASPVVTSQRDSSTEASPTHSSTYGPGSLGFTYEVCAGIVDKSLSLKQIAQEEVLEETGMYVSFLLVLMVRFYL